MDNLLKKKIENRETELQRSYDLSKARLAKLEAEKYNIGFRLTDIETEIKMHKKIIETCKVRALEQDSLHIL